MKQPVTVLNLGLAPYQQVWELQKQLHASLLAGSGKQFLLLVEHPSVVTLGRGAKEATLKSPIVELEAAGIEVFHIERGGDVTYHGPGQLVAYPILDLNKHRRDVGWYMRSLEEVVIRTLNDFGVVGLRVPNRTGVWVAKTSGETASSAVCSALTNLKICSIGVRLSRWCTYHGLSVNVLSATKGFDHIHPCGCPDVVVTSLVEHLQQESYDSEAMLIPRVKQLISKNFSSVFECEATISTCDETDWFSTIA